MFSLVSVYQVRKRYSDGRGAARVDKEGDITVSFPRAPPPSSSSSSTSTDTKGVGKRDEDFADTVDDDEGDEEQTEGQQDRHDAWRFLLAGGIAGAGQSFFLGSQSLTSSVLPSPLPFAI